ncbi:chaperonin GroEL [Paractinoplanes rishiriensis]|uniref:60 kDa chaperonin n=1 Tax=Paractinoplanes rishiriensis TaxID=1050105 RepID=A0A919MYE1_9ACTN|nr:chaperonin GroEL [Actinoplanes rishiriensis]GIF00074.1 hypothetical protein Ari01nite_75380 [Actinoplanes rishiriensis]
MGRFALLIAAGEYEDQTLNQLRAPHQDVDRLAAILEAPEVGGFTSVAVLRDSPDHQVRMAIEELLAERMRDDLVLVYFSCHGLVDGLHRLYFASTNSRHLRPAGTAVSRTFVNEQLEACAASAKVLILDCCYSGAFAEGFKAAPKSALDGQVGRGYVVLAASDAYEYAYEGDSVTDAAPHASVFTDVMIEGLGSGAADLDGDGRIGVDELFRYVQEGVRRRHPNQTPRFFANDAELNIYLAAVAADPGRVAGPRQTAGTAVAPVRPNRPSHYNRNQVIVARGMRAAADRIRLMLGPLGRRILVEGENGAFVETDNAGAFTSRYRPADPRDGVGAGYADEIITQMRRQVGDGTATAVVLAQAMMDGAAGALRVGAHPMALVRGVEAGVTLAVEALPRLARDVETKEQIAAFASVAGGDPVVGEILAEALDKVGKDGVITVEEMNSFGLELELTEGTRWEKGYISRHFITDLERMEAVLDDPYILLVNAKILWVKDLLPIMEKVLGSGKPLLIIAEDVDGEALATLVVNKQRETFTSVAVRGPGFGDRRKAILEDIAVMTGARLITSEADIPWQDITLEQLGMARKVVVTKEETTIIDGAGRPDDMTFRVDQIRAEINAVDNDYDREKLMERLAKVAGGVAVIKVGADTEAELDERKGRFERMIRATKVAVDEGLLSGGCTVLCALSGVVAAAIQNTDEGSGVRIVAESLEAPYVQLLANAGIATPVPPGLEIDVLTGARADLFGAGIYDAAGVLRCALETARDATIRFLKVA